MKKRGTRPRLMGKAQGRNRKKTWLLNLLDSAATIRLCPRAMADGPTGTALGHET